MAVPFRRAIVIVLDSVGIGELPDADAYGDQGSNTVGHIASRISLKVPALRALGLDRLVSLGVPPAARPASGVPNAAAALGAPSAPVPCAIGRMAEASPGKDSVTGHWELMGVVLDRAFPVFPHGFAAEVIQEFSRRTGRGVLGNKAA